MVDKSNIALDDWKAIQRWMVEWHLSHEHCRIVYAEIFKTKVRALVLARNAVLLAVAEAWWQIDDAGVRRLLRPGGACPAIPWQPISQSTLARLFALKEHSSVNAILAAAERRRLAAEEKASVAAAATEV